MSISFRILFSEILGKNFTPENFRDKIYDHENVAH